MGIISFSLIFMLESFAYCYLSCFSTVIMFISEPKGQLLMIDGKTEEDVSRSLERVLLTMRITASEPKVHLLS